MKYYPPKAVEAFGKALCSKLGIPAPVFGTGQPCTDGTTVYLPALTTPTDYVGFLSECSTCLHECSHLFYGSVPTHQAFIAAGSGSREKRHAAMNAVLDVWDETAITTEVSGAAPMFKQSYHSCWNNWRSSDAIENAVKRGDSVWAVVAVSIWSVRGQTLNLVSPRGRLCWNLPTVERDAALAVKTVLRRVEKMALKDPTRHRSRRTIGALNRAAEAIVKILETLPDPPTGSNGQDVLPGNAGALPAARQQREVAPGPLDVEASDDDAIACVSTGRADSNGCTAKCDPAAAASIAAAVSRNLAAIEASRFADGDDDGHASGRRFTDPVRAATDGRCFARVMPNEGERLHVAVSVDASESMAPIAKDALTAATAFVAALTPRSEPDRLLQTFGMGSERVKDFSRADLTGCTDTHRALNDAEQWFASKKGRKVHVVITDGMPSDPQATTAAYRRSEAAGVRHIPVLIGRAASLPKYTAKAAQIMPGRWALCPDLASLPSQLAGIAREIVSSRE